MHSSSTYPQQTYASTRVLNSYTQYIALLDTVYALARDTETEADERTSGDELETGRSKEARRAAHQTGKPQPRQYKLAERFRHFDQAPEMLVIPAGNFQMGAHPMDPDAQGKEKPRREIVLPSPIAVGITPVTFEQWDACVADGGTRYKPEDSNWGRGPRPIINVSWHDAEEYAGWLTRKTGERYRLLSEAEWEYACWAGASQADRYPWGADNGFRQLEHHAWYTANANSRTQPVGGRHPNAWGLQDMLGNVAEWVHDTFRPDLSVVPADAKPYQTAERGASRVLKGGSWLDSPRAVRPSARSCFQPDHRSYRVGFRVAMELNAVSNL